MLNANSIRNFLFSNIIHFYLAIALGTGLLSAAFITFHSTVTDSFQEYSQEIPDTSLSINMVPVEGGTFVMGSPESETGPSNNGGPQRKVYLDSFWMGKYEITWEQYELFSNDVITNLRNELDATDQNFDITADAISLPTPPYLDMSFGMGKEGYPAINITHYAAIMFTKWLTAKTGEFYRLPTEAEWEYACRAGHDTPYSFGSKPDELGQYAWYESNSERSYNLVGEKNPNAFGLHDMHGNVAEWTMDQYHEDYIDRLEASDDGIVYNPWFKPTDLYPRSVRGGSWQDDADMQQCTQRRGSNPRWKMHDPQIPKSLWWHTNASFLGFRIVRPKETPSEEEMQQYWIEAIQDY